MVFAAASFFAGCASQDSQSGSRPAEVQKSEITNAADQEQQEDTASQRISREEAVRIVLNRVEGAGESDIQELKTDRDDGQFVYEGELLFDGYEYEFEIDGTTGEMIQWEIDRE